jgi:hypothetical protein
VRAPVSPGFFNTLGLAVLAGRDFDWRDHSHSRRVAVISQNLADRVFGGRTPSVNVFVLASPRRTRTPVMKRSSRRCVMLDRESARR